MTRDEITAALDGQERAERVTTHYPERRTRGGRVIKFIETHCVFTNGKWVGKPFRLLGWQKELLYELFEVVPNPAYPATSELAWKRRYRWALLGVPKKNGKSELAAALALYFLIGDGEGSPLVAIAAASEEQANLVYGAAKMMCELSPSLAPITERFDREILLTGVPGAKLMRVAAAAGTNDGLNIHACILDELHEWIGEKGQAVWNVLTNGTGAREQPMVFQITTAGWDMESICYQQYEYGKKVISGEVDDPTYFFRWYEAAPGSDYRHPSTWQSANPSFGITIQESFFEDQLSKKSEAVFRRYFLNQWTSAEELWLPAGLWESLEDPDFAFDPKLPMFIGWDAATKYDSTAVVCAQWQGENLYARARIWERPVHPATGRPIEEWTLPIGEVEQYIRDLHRDYNVEAVGFDPAFLTWSAQQLADEGLPMEEVPQTNARMIPATQNLYQLLTQCKLRHDGDPGFARHMRNVVAVQANGSDGGTRLTKRRAKRKVDAAIALVMAVWLAYQPLSHKPAKPRLWVWNEETHRAVA